MGWAVRQSKGKITYLRNCGEQRETIEDCIEKCHDVIECTENSDDYGECRERYEAKQIINAITDNKEVKSRHMTAFYRRALAKEDALKNEKRKLAAARNKESKEVDKVAELAAAIGVTSLGVGAPPNISRNFLRFTNMCEITQKVHSFILTCSIC